MTTRPEPMIVVNTDFVVGFEIVEMLGLVKGNTVRVRHWGRDMAARLRRIVGGEISAYTQMQTDAREEALGRMAAEAQLLGANGVINVRFIASSLLDNAAEVMAYGTAVRLRPEGQSEVRSLKSEEDSPKAEG